MLVIQHLDFGELASIDMLRDAAALFSFGKSSQELLRTVTSSVTRLDARFLSMWRCELL